MFLTKTDSLGNLSWSKKFPDSVPVFVGDIKQTNNGGFIVTGGTGDIPLLQDTSKMFLIKTDSIGNILWTNYYSNISWGDRIVFNSKNEIIVSGGVYSQINGSLDIAITKFDPNGIFLNGFSKGSSLVEFEYDFIPTLDGGCILSGRSYSGTIGGPILMKFDSLLNIEFEKQYTFSTSSSWAFESIIQTPDSGFLCTLSFRILRLDKTGNVLWDKSQSQNSYSPSSFASFDLGDGFLVLGNVVIGWWVTTFVRTDSIGDVPGCTIIPISTPVPNNISLPSQPIIPISFVKNLTDTIFILADSNFIVIDSIKCLNVVQVQEQNSDLNEIIIYPNPASNELNVKILIPTNFLKCIIYNEFGEELYQKEKLLTDNFTIDISLLNEGIYFLKLIGKNGSAFSRKFSIIR
jgi:hypothetical protein